MPNVASIEEWLAARRELLDAEKAFQKARDELAQKRRDLPWRELTTDYLFDAEGGERSLFDLFGDASQLLVYHFMFHPEWDAGCKSCSLWADSYNGSVTHLKARDVSMIAVSRAPLDLLLAYRERMGCCVCRPIPKSFAATIFSTSLSGITSPFLFVANLLRISAFHIHSSSIWDGASKKSSSVEIPEKSNHS